LNQGHADRLQETFVSMGSKQSALTKTGLPPAHVTSTMGGAFPAATAVATWRPALSVITYEKPLTPIGAEPSME
jgi:hypothetical protein